MEECIYTSGVNFPFVLHHTALKSLLANKRSCWKLMKYDEISKEIFTERKHNRIVNTDEAKSFKHLREYWRNVFCNIIYLPSSHNYHT